MALSFEEYRDQHYAKRKRPPKPPVKPNRKDAIAAVIAERGGPFIIAVVLAGITTLFLSAVRTIPAAMTLEQAHGTWGWLYGALTPLAFELMLFGVPAMMTVRRGTTEIGGLSFLLASVTAVAVIVPLAALSLEGSQADVFAEEAWLWAKRIAMFTQVFGIVVMAIIGGHIVAVAYNIWALAQGADERQYQQALRTYERRLDEWTQSAWQSYVRLRERGALPQSAAAVHEEKRTSQNITALVRKYLEHYGVSACDVAPAAIANAMNIANTGAVRTALHRVRKEEGCGQLA